MTIVRVRVLAAGALPAGVQREFLRQLPLPFVGYEAGTLTTDPQSFLDHHRGQVDAAKLLAEIPVPEVGTTVLALVREDLFVPVLTYVFGLSELGGRRGVLSLARLADGEGGIEVLRRRLLIEGIHELGHTVGLVHCPVPECAMHRSLWPEQVELKRPELCPGCLEFARAACS